MKLRRRAFLQLLGAAPLAALAPWRPPAIVGWDLASGPSYCVIGSYVGNGAAARVVLPHLYAQYLIVWHEDGVAVLQPRECV